ncbi:molybdopterin-dependent oxidoreductase [Thermococcus stetteri]|uniref:molybdopterin-dependent oxidoreductase n=1 Tax=Thermococcus stetteri TaxID=49900 RepID=UPI001AE6ACF2|nr:molybdopterin-dependent oxidoreductase [Thermococcus stetteri]MBP1911073.1 DMSO/TMAO reductase YedYZ molybdopterin-dependent catalytic subunit [Thermococcus stetteri]
MKKSLFAVLVLLLLAGAYYFGQSEGESEKTEEVSAGPVIEVTGLVERPYNITLGELKAMPSKTLNAVLYCVDAPNKPRKNGTWTGVPLSYLLQKAGVKDGALKVALYASDGYTTDLYLRDVMEDESIIVAYEYNGKEIDPRLVVPGRWGYKWIKHLRKIEVVDYDFKGTWESVGYPDDAYVVNEENPWR